MIGIKPSPYSQSFHAIEKAQEANVALLTTFRDRMKDYAESLDSMNATISKISNALPEKPNKNILKLSGNVTFENSNPKLTSLWLNVSEKYLNQDPCLSILSQRIQEVFVTKIEEVCTAFQNGIKEILDEYNQVKDDFQAQISEFAAVDGKYRFLCKQIEEYKEKVDKFTEKGKKQDFIDKYKSVLAEAKNQLAPAQDDCLQALKLLNAHALQYTAKCETILQKYEEFDHQHTQELEAVFTSFRSVSSELSQTKLQAGTELQSDLSQLAEFNEKLAVDPEIDEVEPLFETYSPITCSVDLTQYVDPAKLFQTELSELRYSFKDDYSSENDGVIDFPRGTVVTVIVEKSGSKAQNLKSKMKSTFSRKVRVVNEKTGQYTKLPLNLLQRESDKDRKLAKLKVDIPISKQTNLAGKAGDSVLVNSVENGIAYCYDIFHRFGEIPVSNLNM